MNPETPYKTRVRAVGDRLEGRVFSVNGGPLRLVTSVDVDSGFATVTAGACSEPVRMSIPEVMWWLMRDRQERERREEIIAAARLANARNLEDLCRRYH